MFVGAQKAEGVAAKVIAGIPRIDSLPQVPAQSMQKEKIMNSVIYIVGLVVVIIAVMSFFGLR